MSAEKRKIQIIKQRIKLFEKQIYSCKDHKQMWKMQERLTELRLKLLNLEEQFQSGKE